MNEIKPTVSIIIVTWNNENDIKDCLESIIIQDYPHINGIIVVDNASNDNTVKIIEERFKDIDLIKLKKNQFFTGGYNTGLKHAIKAFNSKYLLILNPDTKSETNLISELVMAIEKNNQIGIVGPKIKFWNNENEDKINSAGLIYDGFKQAYDRGFLEDDNGQYDKKEYVKAISGCCMLFRQELLNEIGFFLESLELYLEDLEICIRASKYGWKIQYVPSTTVGHKWMQSTNKNKLIQIDKLKKRNWLKIAIRHYSFKGKLAMIKHFLFNEF